MSCQQSEKVQAWYDGELPPGHGGTIAEHVSQCAECAEMVAELTRVSELLRSAPRASMSADALKRLEQSWWAARDRGVLRFAEWLTAAAAAVLIGALLMFGSNDDRGMTGITHNDALEVAVMPPSSAREDSAGETVALAEWMANDLSVDSGLTSGQGR